MPAVASLAKAPYRPYGAVDLIWRCRKPAILCDGPAGSGKTRGILEKLYLIAAKYPGARILITRKTRASCTQSVLVTWEDKVLPVGCSMLRGAQRASREQYTFPNGSIVAVGGMDKPERIKSSEWDIIFYCEATEGTLEDFELCRSRLRNGVVPYQQIICDCNPSHPGHWLKKLADEGKIHRIISRHSDNPSVTKDYLATLDQLTGHRRERLLHGKWVAADGLIYDVYDERKHVVDKPARKWERAIIGVDEGFTNPCSMHLYLVDGDNRVHVRREFYHRKQLPEAQVAWAKRMQRAVRKAYQFDVEAVIVDPSAAKLIQALAEGGLPVQGADNDVSDGIKRVYEALQDRGDGESLLTIAPECIEMRNEFNSYRWAKNAAGQNKDVPHKEDDHTMDECRYVHNYLAVSSGSWEVITL